MMMKSSIPVIMAGMIGIYGLIISVFISTNISKNNYSAFLGWTHLGAGLAVGLSGLAAGMCIGVIGDAGVRANAQEEKLFVAMVLMLVFSEALGLYGLIIGLIMAVKKDDVNT
uniref:V-type proton ATPase proteolipid subunit n=1 Tax=Arcella intermedia TaxID=1963864 RepID=A0A6B2LNQ7_9EUKA